jgi:nitrogen fixation/metabolism regulation signal transduction histidine kinase
MPINNQEINKNREKKKISREQLIYIAIFIIYATIVIILFIYAVQFLGRTINSAFSQPTNAVIEAKYGQLHLTEYSIIANKLGLINNQTAAPIQEASEDTSVDISSTTDEIILLNTTEQINTPTSAPEITIPENILPTVNLETRPTITIINSTLTSGLAAELKNTLQTAGFEVLRTGNIRPSEPQTIIKVKNNTNQASDYFSDVKKAVSKKYDFKITTLPDNSTQDIEIIIGNK